MGDSQYSFSLTSFSPTGKLVQIEQALTAVGSGQTSLGIKAANGVVIATEKKLPSILVDESSVQKIQNLTPNIGVVYRFFSACFSVIRRSNGAGKILAVFPGFSRNEGGLLKVEDARHTPMIWPTF
ncbi:proteasome subunit alpha type-2-like isoform X1 [Populus alba]|uniref:proteasome subunit alpha type-2-like isoform X1 n=1 Tax=Populus alba TaxID=43335 RepID=UPI00158F0161|nr:proteasome subunit alpha type-2-like isoform X1 [Populus alba]